MKTERTLRIELLEEGVYPDGDRIKLGSSAREISDAEIKQLVFGRPFDLLKEVEKLAAKLECRQPPAYDEAELAAVIEKSKGFWDGVDARDLREGIHPDTKRLDFLLRFLSVEDIGDDGVIPGVVVANEELENAFNYGAIADEQVGICGCKAPDFRRVIDKAIAFNSDFYDSIAYARSALRATSKVKEGE